MISDTCTSHHERRLTACGQRAPDITVRIRSSAAALTLHDGLDIRRVREGVEIPGEERGRDRPDLGQVVRRGAEAVVVFEIADGTEVEAAEAGGADPLREVRDVLDRGARGVVCAVDGPARVVHVRARAGHAP
eukprot:3657447-Rhodomonas_salina.2